MAPLPDAVSAPGEAERQGARLGRLTPAQQERFHGFLAEIFGALGLPPDRPGTRRTPERFLAAIHEATSGYEGDPKLITTFPTECRGGPDCRIAQVVEGPIPYFSLCEHHALPFFGRAHVGYIAHQDIIGLSKLTRVVRLYARRFTVQERLGQEIVEFLDTLLGAHGIAVYLEATHMCTQMRGVRELQSSTKTTFWRGSYDQDPGLRREFLALCGRSGLAEPC
ncbi:MAG: GTP cyclohydrolase I [Candidatus Dormibacteraeota bacterium]|nr:GTP cyclohydrolase I [Candidatus Dormibacteraeota bacterium]